MQKWFLLIPVILLAAFTFGGAPTGGKVIPVRFSHPDIIRYDHDGFIVRGKPVFIYSGSFHYFRCDPGDWMDRLEKIKAAGFNTIEAYVPWNWHERTEGHADFSELEKFLDDCSNEGIYVIVRPGPYICAEWNIGGFPGWLEGKDIGFRTASPADIRWSKYWYDEVLPVIRKHLITNGGCIILMQIENEYNYFTLPDSDKVIYLKSLYDTAMKNGIDVPIITCWTSQVRDDSDSVFSQIMDACNFYPWWDFGSTLLPIREMEKEEPESPPMVTELQGGWFSSVGGGSVRSVDGLGADQVTGLTGYVIAHGIKALNYYMLYGGTNFGYWGAQDKTTSYDYTAPISEPGGLWEKYRAVKLIGDFIKLEGEHLVKSHEVENGAESETPGVDAIVRSDGNSGFLFVQNKKNDKVEAKIRFRPPVGSAVSMTVPLGPRETRLLPVDLPLPGGSTLYYTNVPISSVTEYKGKPLIIAYGTPGEEATIYAGSSMCTEEITGTDRLFNWDGVYVLLTSEERAARSRVFETPAGSLSLISDSYLTLGAGTTGKTTEVNIQSRPGEDSFSLLGPENIASVSVDGRRVRTITDGRPGVTKFSLQTASIKLTDAPIQDVRARSDADASVKPSWEPIVTAGDTVPPLETCGDYMGGYTVYEGQFSTQAAGLIKADYYFGEWHSVLVDGKTVEGLTGNDEEDISKAEIPAGSHSMEVIYENQGWPNGGYMEQHKGLKSISFCSAGQRYKVDTWKHAPAASPFPGPDPAEASDSFDDAGWNRVKVGDGNQSFIKPDEGWWFRTHITMSQEAVSQNPTLTFGAVDDNALVYVNGRLANRHTGYDSPFTVKLGSFARAGDNVIAVYVQNLNNGGGIWKPVIFKWANATPLDVTLRFHHSLGGQLAGWQEKNFDDSGWEHIRNWSPVRSGDGITWYRGTFTVPSRPGWIIPWRLHLVATGSAQIWINGRLLGRYSSRGPQTDFYLPHDWIAGKGNNSITIVLRPGADLTKPPAISEAYFSPYDEYVVREHKVSITLK